MIKVTKKYHGLVDDLKPKCNKGQGFHEAEDIQPALFVRQACASKTHAAFPVLVQHMQPRADIERPNWSCHVMPALI